MATGPDCALQDVSSLYGMQHAYVTRCSFARKDLKEAVMSKKKLVEALQEGSLLYRMQSCLRGQIVP